MTIYNEWPIEQFMKFVTYIEICNASESEQVENEKQELAASRNK